MGTTPPPRHRPSSGHPVIGTKDKDSPKAEFNQTFLSWTEGPLTTPFLEVYLVLCVHLGSLTPRVSVPTHETVWVVSPYTVFGTSNILPVTLHLLDRSVRPL